MKILKIGFHLIGSALIFLTTTSSPTFAATEMQHSATAGNLYHVPAVIIAPHFVLTAYHKFASIQRPKDFVFIGGKQFPIRNYFTSPTSAFLIRDLMLIQFDGDIPDGYAPVEMANPDAVKVGVTVQLKGIIHDDWDRPQNVSFGPIQITNIQQTELFEKFTLREDAIRSCDPEADNTYYDYTGLSAFVIVDGKTKLVGIKSEHRCANGKSTGLYEMPAFQRQWIDTIIHKENKR